MSICLGGYINNMVRSCAICCIEKATPNYFSRAFLYTSSLVSHTCMLIHLYNLNYVFW